VDGANIYWEELATEGDREIPIVRMAPKSGAGPVRDLGPWSDYQTASSMVMDDHHVYWMTGGKLTRVGKDGSGRTELDLPDVDSLDPGPLQDAGDAIVVGSQACRFLTRVPKDGSPAQSWPVTKRPAAGGVTGLDVDGPIYYCSNGQAVHVLDTRTGQAREVVSYPGRVGLVRKVGGDLYWADSDNPETRKSAIVWLAVDGQGPKAVAPAYGQAASLLVDSSRGRLYWMTGLSNYDCDALVFDLKTRESAFLGRNLDVYGDAAQDDVYLYWVASHSIMRARK
jgi:hypothetical protein